MIASTQPTVWSTIKATIARHPAGAFLRTWGSVGDGNGQFHAAEDVDIGADGTVWVANEGDGVLSRVPTSTLTSFVVQGLRRSLASSIISNSNPAGWRTRRYFVPNRS